VYATGSLTKFYTDISTDDLIVPNDPKKIPIDNTKSKFAGTVSSSNVVYYISHMSLSETQQLYWRFPLANLYCVSSFVVVYR